MLQIGQITGVMSVIAPCVVLEMKSQLRVRSRHANLAVCACSKAGFVMSLAASSHQLEMRGTYAGRLLQGCATRSQISVGTPASGFSNSDRSNALFNCDSVF